MASDFQVFPEKYGNPNERSVEKPEGTSVSFGMSIQGLTEQQRETLGVKQPGVKVYEVEPASFAEDIGLLANDVITAINQQPVATTDDVKRIQNTLKPGDAVAFRVLRGGGQQRGGGQWTTLYLAGTLPHTAQK